ncbi:MAG: ABC transporter ATP-binding protein [Calditrichaeota bacterium]|nr:MAG: ABC transporter ATP-binding protein [Calditrichota bacterium]
MHNIENALQGASPAGTGGEEIVRCERLEKIYQDNKVPVVALRGVDFSLSRGEFSVVAGPSGSGKTTLLNMLGALDRPTRGRVIFEGEDLAQKSRRELADLRLRKIGFVFQAYNLIPVLTALENIEFTMMLSGVPERERRRRALALMEELGIAELADKRPGEMSGGQQQRVAVARAIINTPALVLADEPTANLDSETGARLLDLMAEMNQKKGITFLFSSHDPQVMARARRVILLRDGQIVEDRLQDSP